MGVNDLVLKLYRRAAHHYEQRHPARIDVRYGMGLPADALPNLATALQQLMEMDSRAELEAPIPFDR